MRPEHKTQKPEDEMTHADYVKSDLHRGRIRLAANSFSLIEIRCDLIRRCIQRGHFDDAERYAESLEDDLETAMNNLNQVSDAVTFALERFGTVVQ